MDKVTKSKVRSEFAYARDLMRQANEAMQTVNPTEEQLEDFDQIAMELTAAVSTFAAWIAAQPQFKAEEWK